MSRKKFDNELIKDNHGPMNSVSKDDALVWAGAPDVDDLKKLQPGLRRGVLAKKLKKVLRKLIEISANKLKESTQRNRDGR